MSEGVVVWTPGDARVWWSCPVCKVEGGATPPIVVSDFVARLKRFQEAHKDCATNKETTWQRSGR
jgi:hypothetical protein